MVKKATNKKKPMGVQAAMMMAVKPKDPEDMSLAERMHAKFGKDLPIKSSIFSGK